MQLGRWLQRLGVSDIAAFAGFVRRAVSVISAWRFGSLTRKTMSENVEPSVALPSGVQQIRESQKKWEEFNRQGYYVKVYCDACESTIDNDEALEDYIDRITAKASLQNCLPVRTARAVRRQNNNQKQNEGRANRKAVRQNRKARPSRSRKVAKPPKKGRAKSVRRK